MMFPFDSLNAANREWGLVVAVVLGFGMGFVLERAGFGRSTKLAAQFYLYDMTVFKVMFSAIVTAMLGAAVAGQLGLLDWRALADTATSATYLWPMLVGGVLLGIGFIVAGYCPGTSAVAMASGNIDGLVAFVGVILGTFVYSEVFSLIEKFHNSSYLGGYYLTDLLHLPVPVVALLVVLMAVGCFIGAEKVEKIFRSRLGQPEPLTVTPGRDAIGIVRAVLGAPRRFAFSTFVALAVLGVAGLALPRPQAAEKQLSVIAAPDLARRVLEEPWKVRVLDLRKREACVASRVPGSECAPAETLETLGLQDDAGARDLVLVADEELSRAPKAALAYAGRVLVLQGGYSGWKGYALKPPVLPEASASPEAFEEYRLRSGIYSAMTGVKQAPPPPPPSATAAPMKKKGGGGCSG